MPEQPASLLYTAVRAQPAIIREVLGRVPDLAAAAVDLLAPARRIWLAGTGTSSHAAIVGEHLLQLAGGDAFATTMLDFALYSRPLDPHDVLIAISHRGSKRYGALAIAEALGAGLPVIGITGQDSPMEGPRVLIPTAPQERSSTHSASYTANLAALALIACELGTRNGHDMALLREEVAALPDAVEAVLAQEAAIRDVAVYLAQRGRLVLAGAGPHAATAREGALKVKESSYLTAEGFELETLLHGALPAVAEGDLAAVLVADGPALARDQDAIRALQLIGARLLVVADERVVDVVEATVAESPEVTVVTYPATLEALSPLPATVALQLLAAYTAQIRGTDADSFRNDDPRYKGANDSYRL